RTSDLSGPAATNPTARPAARAALAPAVTANHRDSARNRLRCPNTAPVATPSSPAKTPTSHADQSSGCPATSATTAAAVVAYTARPSTRYRLQYTHASSTPASPPPTTAAARGGNRCSSGGDRTRQSAAVPAAASGGSR